MKEITLFVVFVSSFFVGFNIDSLMYTKCCIRDHISGQCLCYAKPGTSDCSICGPKPISN